VVEQRRDRKTKKLKPGEGSSVTGRKAVRKGESHTRQAVNQRDGLRPVLKMETKENSNRRRALKTSRLCNEKTQEARTTTVLPSRESDHETNHSFQRKVLGCEVGGFARERGLGGCAESQALHRLPSSKKRKHAQIGSASVKKLIQARDYARAHVTGSKRTKGPPVCKAALTSARPRQHAPRWSKVSHQRGGDWTGCKKMGCQTGKKKKGAENNGPVNRQKATVNEGKKDRQRGATKLILQERKAKQSAKGITGQRDELGKKGKS